MSNIEYIILNTFPRQLKAIKTKRCWPRYAKRYRINENSKNIKMNEKKRRKREREQEINFEFIDFVGNNY